MYIQSNMSEYGFMRDNLASCVGSCVLCLNSEILRLYLAALRKNAE